MYGILYKFYMQKEVPPFYQPKIICLKIVKKPFFIILLLENISKTMHYVVVAAL